MVNNGTWLLWLSIYWECHYPYWRTHIFQRGRSTTNQLDYLYLYIINGGTQWQTKHLSGLLKKTFQNMVIHPGCDKHVFPDCVCHRENHCESAKIHLARGLLWLRIDSVCLRSSVSGPFANDGREAAPWLQQVLPESWKTPGWMKLVKQGITWYNISQRWLYKVKLAIKLALWHIWSYQYV
jgi:hypothetical protein